jgi:hypothetical protein
MSIHQRGQVKQTNLSKQKGKSLCIIKIEEEKNKGRDCMAASHHVDT